MSKELTEKQELVLRVVRDYFLENGCAPSLAELQNLLSISTKRGVVIHLMALEKKGFIIRTSEPRGIRLVEEEEEPVYEFLIGIPILGYVNAGTPLVSAEEEFLGNIKVQDRILGKGRNLFSVIVKGDSMNEERVGNKKLADGSYLIVDKDAEINNGDVVVAIIENAATVKKFKRDKDMIILYPNSSNPIHQPIYLHNDSESLINGRVVKVLENPAI